MKKILVCFYDNGLSPHHRKCLLFFLCYLGKCNFVVISCALNVREPETQDEAVKSDMEVLI